MESGPRTTNAEMAQPVAMVEDAGLVQRHTDKEGREVYRLPGRLCGVDLGRGGETSRSTTTALISITTALTSIRLPRRGLMSGERH